MFAPGDVVVLMLAMFDGYPYHNPVGHLATVGPRGTHLGGYRSYNYYVDVIWDKPSAMTDGGYHVEVFQHVGGPW